MMKYKHRGHNLQITITMSQFTTQVKVQTRTISHFTTQSANMNKPIQAKLKFQG